MVSWTSGRLGTGPAQRRKNRSKLFQIQGHPPPRGSSSENSRQGLTAERLCSGYRATPARPALNGLSHPSLDAREEISNFLLHRKWSGHRRGCFVFLYRSTLCTPELIRTVVAPGLVTPIHHTVHSCWGPSSFPFYKPQVPLGPWKSIPCVMTITLARTSTGDSW